MKDKIKVYKLIRTIIVVILCIVGIAAGFITKHDNKVSSVCLCLLVMVYTSLTDKIENLYDEKLKESLNKIEEKIV